jgi:hypothetical protein
VTMMIGERIRILRVTALPLRRGPAAEAVQHYAELETDAPHSALIQG